MMAKKLYGGRIGEWVNKRLALFSGALNTTTAVWIVNVFLQIAVDHKRDINSQNDIIIL